MIKIDPIDLDKVNIEFDKSMLITGDIVTNYNNSKIYRYVSYEQLHKYDHFDGRSSLVNNKLYDLTQRACICYVCDTHDKSKCFMNFMDVAAYNDDLTIGEPDTDEYQNFTIQKIYRDYASPLVKHHFLKETMLKNIKTTALIYNRI